MSVLIYVIGLVLLACGIVLQIEQGDRARVALADAQTAQAARQRQERAVQEARNREQLDAELERQQSQDRLADIEEEFGLINTAREVWIKKAAQKRAYEAWLAITHPEEVPTGLDYWKLQDDLNTAHQCLSSMGALQQENGVWVLRDVHRTFRSGKQEYVMILRSDGTRARTGPGITVETAPVTP